MGLGDGKWEKRFLSDISANVTVVPNLLIKYYRQLGLNETDFIFLIQIFALTRSGCPVVEQIAELLEMDISEVRKNMAALMEKGIITAESRLEKGAARVTRYFFDGLYDKLMDIWACQLAGELEPVVSAPEKTAVGQPGAAKGSDNFARVYTAFEKEFGRTLSPMESDQIIEWLDHLSCQPEIVLEALKRAVLRGILKFNYVDRILQEWRKANLRSLSEIQKHEGDKMGREKTGRKKTAVPVRAVKDYSLYEI